MLIDDIERKEPAFVKRHAYNAYLAYVNNKRRRGLYVAMFDNVQDALMNFDHPCMYFMDPDDIRKISRTIRVGCEEGACNLEDCYKEYDHSSQVMLLICVDDQKFFQIITLTDEETAEWLSHVDCVETAGVSTDTLEVLSTPAEDKKENLI